MNGRGSPEHTDVAHDATTSFDVEAATVALVEAQRLAAEKRAIAENVLAEARAFEQQLAAESESVATMMSIVAVAQTAEAEAAARLSGARDKLAALIAAEADARAEVETAQTLLRERREARVAAETGVAQMRARIELLSGTNGLHPDALKRIVERRLADRLRQSAERPAW
jgi:chromosome segregation ATPase